MVAKDVQDAKMIDPMSGYIIVTKFKKVNQL